MDRAWVAASNGVAAPFAVEAGEWRSICLSSDRCARRWCGWSRLGVGIDRARTYITKDNPDGPERQTGNRLGAMATSAMSTGSCAIVPLLGRRRCGHLSSSLRSNNQCKARQRVRERSQRVAMTQTASEDARVSQPTDLAIARSAPLRPLDRLAKDMGIPAELLEPYGRGVAKIDLAAIDALADRPPAPNGVGS